MIGGDRSRAARSEKEPLLGSKEYMSDSNPVASQESDLGDVKKKQDEFPGKIVDQDEDIDTAGACHPETSVLKVIIKLSACTIAGMVFGLALEKSRVFEPASIRGQMVFQRWIMLKMFLAAMGTGQLMLAVLAFIPQAQPTFQASYASYAAVFVDKGFLTSSIGPFILGCGMTVSGACPGMVLAQIGSWTNNAMFTLIGVFIGSLTYGLFAPYIIQLTKPKERLSILTVQEQFNLPYSLLATGMGAVVMIFVAILELVVPWEDDLDSYNRNDNITGNIFELRSWPPSVSGCLIGALQLVIIFAIGDTLGGSSSYMTLVSQWVCTDSLKEKFPHLAKFRCGLGNWWQVFYVTGAMVGAFLSALGSDGVAEAKGVQIPSALIGGFLLLFGARLASGCTSGHGLSGTALFFWFSLLAVPCMFGGGIITGFIMDGLDLLDDYDCFDSNDPCEGTSW